MYQVCELAEFGIEPYPASKVIMGRLVPQIGNDAEHGVVPGGVL